MSSCKNNKRESRPLLRNIQRAEKREAKRINRSMIQRRYYLKKREMKAQKEKINVEMIYRAELEISARPRYRCDFRDLEIKLNPVAFMNKLFWRLPPKEEFSIPEHSIM